MIITSAEHGVEGYVGSAIQQLFIEKILPHWDLSETTIVLVHAVNPWGFSNNRRVSEKNIDLNRNFFDENEIQEFDNPFYAHLENLLNPQSPATHGSISSFRLIWKVIRAVRKYGIYSVREALLKGQKQFPKGMFFSGRTLDPNCSQLIDRIQDWTQDLQSVLHLSLHTGFGARGEMHLIEPVSLPRQSMDQIQQIFSQFPMHLANDKDFYKVFGGFQDFVHKCLEKKVSYLPMTLEFGTVNNQTLWGGLKSLVTMIKENQGYHYGYKSEKDQREIEKQYLELYYPSSEEWREKIINDVTKLFHIVQSNWVSHPSFGDETASLRFVQPI